MPFIAQAASWLRELPRVSQCIPESLVVARVKVSEPMPAPHFIDWDKIGDVGSNAHTVPKAILFPPRSRKPRRGASASKSPRGRGSAVVAGSLTLQARVSSASGAPRGSGSADGKADGGVGDVEYEIDKHNLLTGFFNQGGEMQPRRLEVYMKNLISGEFHMMTMAEATKEATECMEYTGKYKSVTAPGTNLACFVHVQYLHEMSCVDHGGTTGSKWAIFRIQWDGKVGGSEETVVAVFHVNFDEAKKGHAQPGYSNMKNNLNKFMK